MPSKTSKLPEAHFPFWFIQTRISIPLSIYYENLAGDLTLGRLYIVLSDQIERRLRLEIVKRLGGKKGDLSNAIEESIKMWLDKPATAKT
jgi:hypothetical protein